jgi:hypothetical protein
MLADEKTVPDDFAGHRFASVAPQGRFERPTSALRGRSKRKALHNTSERFRWSEIFSYLHSLTVRNAPFGTILDWILDRFLTAENERGYCISNICLLF